MSLRGIVRALGGDLYDGGRRANIPAPGHSAQDRSVSLLLQGDRVVVHTFGDGDWKAVLDQLREHQLIDAHNVPLDGPGRPVVGRPVREAASARERLETALRLWEDGPAARAIRSPPATAAYAGGRAICRGRRPCATTARSPSRSIARDGCGGPRSWPASRTPRAATSRSR